MYIGQSNWTQNIAYYYFLLFSAVNHLRGPLTKQKLTSPSSKGHGFREGGPGGLGVAPPPQHFSRGKMFLFKYKVHAVSTRLVRVTLHLIQVEFHFREISHWECWKYHFWASKISKYFLGEDASTPTPPPPPTNSHLWREFSSPPPIEIGLIKNLNLPCIQLIASFHNVPFFVAVERICWSSNASISLSWRKNHH